MASEADDRDELVDGGPVRDGPVTPPERLVTLDFIRGIAVLGILAANIVAFGLPESAYSWPGGYPQPLAPADRWIWLAQYVLIDGKMRGLFSLLFGAGMMLFIERAGSQSAACWLQVRRLVWLTLFGLAHFYLLFWGDILFLYGMSGLVALLFARHDPRQLIALGVAWYLAGALFLTAMMAPAITAEHNRSGVVYDRVVAAVRDKAADTDRERAAFAQGSYPAEVAFVARERSSILAGYPRFAAIETVPLMLVGMGLYRCGFFGGGVDRRKMRYLGWAGVLGGLALTLPLGLWPLIEGFPFYLTHFVFDDIGQFARLPMTLGLLALLAARAPAAAGTWLGERIVAAGRMAFSNYIGCSLMMMFVFRHWALGFYDELHRVQLLVLMATGWAAMLAWSKPWLARFRYGPLEWCWRCLTYWRLFPFRRRRSVHQAMT